MPYDPNKCTYTLGALRQQVYACLTCYQSSKEMAGVCYSCSIQCHADHNIVELFTKRNFICDCGTTKTKHPCNLRDKVKDDLPSSSNEYNHNYQGKFCHCERDYNPLEETGNMLQCILGDACLEDWFHDYCIMGLPKFKPEKKPSTGDGVNMLSKLEDPSFGESSAESKPDLNPNQEPVVNEDVKKEDIIEPVINYDSDEEKEIAIDGFPRLDDFDGFICWKCVNKNKEFFNLIKNNEAIVADSLQRIIANSIEDRNKTLTEQTSLLNSIKRRKIEYEYSLFLNDNHEFNFTKYYNGLDKESPEYSKAAVFFENFPYLLQDYPIYEPPQDEDDDNSSIYDMGSKAINSLPREKAIQGVEAYQDIKEKLKTFLTPFAQGGKVVNKNDIESFFSELKKGQK